ncbi:MAG: iron ABC transporter permease [Chlorobiaceae bacterium]|nr:iron ABC transporter permease [Chlorobiaceae bacterium]MBA4310867.1 iron ABC transporter permease [Chlorobiaceae bacterium]
MKSSSNGFIKSNRYLNWLPTLPLVPFLVALFVVLPVIVVASSLFTPNREIWEHLWSTILPEMTRNSIMLVVGVGFGTLILGVSLAWLVTAYNFPGRNTFEWLLILPMAIPTYILGFVYMATFDFAGPVQTFLRSHFDNLAWFPEIRSGGGAILVMTLVLYPYVYLLAKAGFQEQSQNYIDSARTMGYRPLKIFFKLALPLARPSIAAGVLLAIMEALTDFATVRFFNFPTFSDGILRIWHGLMDLPAASELAGLVAIFALILILGEQTLRGRSRFFQSTGKAQGISKISLNGFKAWIATLVCSLVIIISFFLPVAQLFSWTLLELGNLDANVFAVYTEFAFNSIKLSFLAAIFATAIGLILASAIRSSKSKFGFFLGKLATIGYAIPGAVIGVGIILLLSFIDHSLNEVYIWLGGTAIGLVFTGSLIGLIYAYIVRFMAVSFNSVDSSLQKIKPNVTSAARVLGANQWRVTWQIHLPLITPGIFVGFIMVFVDVMKELPVTAMLRPFGYDTLAVWVWQMAAESIWTGAALPALAIVATGLLPVYILTRVFSSSKS